MQLPQRHLILLSGFHYNSPAMTILLAHKLAPPTRSCYCAAIVFASLPLRWLTLVSRKQKCFAGAIVSSATSVTVMAAVSDEYSSQTFTNSPSGTRSPLLSRRIGSVNPVLSTAAIGRCLTHWHGHIYWDDHLLRQQLLTTGNDEMAVRLSCTIKRARDTESWRKQKTFLYDINFNTYNNKERSKDKQKNEPTVLLCFVLNRCDMSLAAYRHPTKLSKRR